ncbi:hypothetical protein Pmani_017749 [Petrolisthes manimaculis]|uniref:Uncharacterized protein n=1 Tax=Petrolisthes manimaculis TaxID=1843537 RepID=A0AAE1PNX8_9EUCA|nr:hypothetical protein Pmani_017749 [Petrolisthes manimaculis]
MVIGAWQPVLAIYTVDVGLRLDSAAQPPLMESLVASHCQCRSRCVAVIGCQKWTSFLSGDGLMCRLLDEASLADVSTITDTTAVSGPNPVTPRGGNPEVQVTTPTTTRTMSTTTSTTPQTTTTIITPETTITARTTPLTTTTTPQTTTTITTPETTITARTTPLTTTTTPQTTTTITTAETTITARTTPLTTTTTPQTTTTITTPETTITARTTPLTTTTTPQKATTTTQTTATTTIPQPTYTTTPQTTTTTTTMTPAKTTTLSQTTTTTTTPQTTTTTPETTATTTPYTTTTTPQTTTTTTTPQTAATTTTPQTTTTTTTPQTATTTTTPYTTTTTPETTTTTTTLETTATTTSSTTTTSLSVTFPSEIRPKHTSCGEGQAVIGLAMHKSDTNLDNFEHLICGWPLAPIEEAFEFEKDSEEFKSMGPGNGMTSPEKCSENMVMTNIRALNSFSPPDFDDKWDSSLYMLKKCKAVSNFKVDGTNCQEVSMTTGPWTGPFEDATTTDWNYWYLCPEGYFTVQITRNSSRQADKMECCKVLPW